MIEQALQHYESGEYAEAKVLFEKMLEQEPENPEVLFMLALVNQQLQNWPAARATLEQAVRVDPNKATFHYSLGSVLLREQQIESAVDSFSKAVELDPNYLEALNALGYCRILQGRFEDAENHLQVALRADPESIPVMVNYGLALLERGKHNDAIAYLQRAVSMDPENSGAQTQLGRAFLAAGQAGFAAQCFDNALQHNPDRPELYELHGKALFEIGEYDEAADRFRRVLDLGMEPPDTLLGLARIAQGKGNSSNAENLFLRALHVAPLRSDIRLAFCRMLITQARFEELGQRLEPLLSDPECAAEARLLLARSFYERGDYQRSLATLGDGPAAMESSPELDLLHIRLLFATGDNLTAQTRLDDMLAAEEPVVDALTLQAEQHLSAGQLDDAEQLLRETRRRHDLDNKRRLTVARLLAEVMHQQGNPQSAWEQLLSLAAHDAEVLQILSEQPLQLQANEAPESAMSREVAWSWPPQPPEDGRPEPVFVIAWPGTGRRRLLAALSSHPGVQLINDPLAGQTERRLIISYPQGAGPLNALSNADVLLARRRYWKSLRRAVIDQVGVGMAIDSIWLSADALPSIYRYFPQARIIVLRRDPADMALSWLFEGYKNTSQMAERYQHELAQLDRCLDMVPLNYSLVDYDALDADSGQILRNLLMELKLPWVDEVGAVFEETRADHIKPAGAWNAYAVWLEESLPSTAADA